MKAKHLVLGLLLLFFGYLLVPSCRTAHGYVDVNRAVRGNSLYLLEYKMRYRRAGLPIPEVPRWVKTGEVRRIAAVDLSGASPLQSIGNYKHVDLSNEKPEIIYFEDSGLPRLVSYDERDRRIRAAVSLPCDSEVRGDSQDFRIVYLFCDRQRTLYRLEAPFDRAIKVTLPEGSSLSGFEYSQRFRSTVGDPYLYVLSGRRFDNPGQFHRVDIGSATPSMLLDLPAGEIIGITSRLRIHDLAHEGPSLQVLVVEGGKPPRRWVFDHPPEGDGTRAASFHAAIGFVTWDFDVLGKRKVALNVHTGTFSQITVPRD